MAVIIVAGVVSAVLLTAGASVLASVNVVFDDQPGIAQSDDVQPDDTARNRLVAVNSSGSLCASGADIAIAAESAQDENCNRRKTRHVAVRSRWLVDVLLFVAAGGLTLATFA